MIGVLVPPYDADPGAPGDRPLGRAALQLEADGVQVVFAHDAHDGILEGVRARPGRWEPATGRPTACYDRFPSQSRPRAYRALRLGLGDVPVANPESLVVLCRDKVACQRALQAAGVHQPPIETVPDRFGAALEGWGSAYLKPRFGAFGRGICRVVPGDPLPSWGEGAVRGEIEPLFLQRAVPPPTGWAGITCRVLVQRTPEGGWHVSPPVARRDRTDPVVNAARGAEVVSLHTIAPGAVAPVRAQALRVTEVLADLPDGHWLVELGVDLALDEAFAPHVLEVNSRPRGRLEALASADEAWWARHVAACARPLRVLAARAAPSP